MLAELRDLRRLGPEERTRRLNSDDLKQRFNEEELELLQDVAAPPQE